MHARAYTRIHHAHDRVELHAVDPESGEMVAEEHGQATTPEPEHENAVHYSCTCSGRGTAAFSCQHVVAVDGSSGSSTSTSSSSTSTSTSTSTSSPSMLLLLLLLLAMMMMMLMMMMRRRPSPLLRAPSLRDAPPLLRVRRDNARWKQRQAGDGSLVQLEVQYFRLQLPVAQQRQRWRRQHAGRHVPCGCCGVRTPPIRRAAGSSLNAAHEFVCDSDGCRICRVAVGV